MGCYGMWDNLETACRLAKERENVYLDTSAFGPYYLLGKAVAWAGIENITFATDGHDFKACAYPQERWLVMGTQGGLAGTHTQLHWKYIHPELLPPRPVSREPTPDRSYNQEELPWIEESCDLSGERRRASNIRLYNGLYATLREGAPLAITPESIQRQMAVMEKCRELSPV